MAMHSYLCSRKQVDFSQRVHLPLAQLGREVDLGCEAGRRSHNHGVSGDGTALAVLAGCAGAVELDPDTVVAVVVVADVGHLGRVRNK